MSDEKVGFIGLGVMGYRIAANLYRAGKLSIVYNRTRSKAEEFAKTYGVEVANSVEELASRSDVIITMLSDDTAVSEVLGHVVPLSEGKLLVDMSTISPLTSAELAARVAKAGGFMFDAPVMGTSIDVEQRRITVLVGGPKEQFPRVERLLQPTAARVVYIGGNGMGLYAKLVGNMMFAIFMGGLSEAINFARAAGLTQEQIMDLFLNISGTRSPSSQLKVPKILSSDFSTQFALKHMRKDVEIMVREAQRLRVPVPITALLASLYRMAENLGLSDLDVSALAEFYSKVSAH